MIREMEFEAFDLAEHAKELRLCFIRYVPENAVDGFDVTDGLGNYLEIFEQFIGVAWEAEQSQEDLLSEYVESQKVRPAFVNGTLL